MWTPNIRMVNDTYRGLYNAVAKTPSRFHARAIDDN